MQAPRVVIVTPSLARANNGNWQTAQRWARMLRGHYRVRCRVDWDGGDDDLMIALHARRSAGAVHAWRQAHGERRPLVLVLTGTDLYRDIQTDPAAQRSLELANRLVVLNELGLQQLPEALQGKAVVSLQSASHRQARPKASRFLRALMVGHLREEKSPQTYFEATRRLAARSDIRLDHIGDALDPRLADEARALMCTHPHYRWLGALPHGATRSRIQAAHVLVHPSRIEGGAHVVTEALCSGTPVLASRIAGNLGLLGADYSGVFDWGDAAALASLLQRARDDEAMLRSLREQCAARAPLFEPERERRTLLGLLAGLLPAQPGTPG